MNEHGKLKFVAKADPLSAIRNNKLIVQGEDMWRTRNVRQVVSSYIEYIVAAFKAAIYEVFLFRILRRL